MCDEYGRLLAVYNRALTLYSTTAAAVAATSDEIPLGEVGRMIGYGDQAKTAAIVAGMELEDHCEEHGCAQFRTAASNKT